MERAYDYYKSCFAGHALPLAWLDWDLLQKNMGYLLGKVQKQGGTKTVRIATKSIRSLEIIKRILGESSVFRGVLSYSPYEAIVLGKSGINDILVAYPTVQKEAIRGVCAALRLGRRITLSVDCIAHVELIEAVAKEQGVAVPICIDLDMSVDFCGVHFGVWRSSLRTVEQVLVLMDFIQRCRFVRVEGVLAYEAQLAGVCDHYPRDWLKNGFVHFLKQHSSKQILARRNALVGAIKQQHPDVRFVNGGGTGSLDFSLTDTTLTEVTVGSLFFGPALFDHYRGFTLFPAAGYAIELTRRPKPDLWTGFAGGYYASGTMGKDKMPQVYLPCAHLTAQEGAGEVQTPIVYRGKEALSLGDPVLLRHAKAGELCERFNSLHLLSTGKAVEQVTTYRGEGWNFG